MFSASSRRAFGQRVRLLLQLNSCPSHNVGDILTTRFLCHPESLLLGSPKKHYTCGTEGKPFTWACDCKSMTSLLYMTWKLVSYLSGAFSEIIAIICRCTVPAAGKELWKWTFLKQHTTGWWCQTLELLLSLACKTPWSSLMTLPPCYAASAVTLS